MRWCGMREPRVCQVVAHRVELQACQVNHLVEESGRHVVPRESGVITGSHDQKVVQPAQAAGMINELFEEQLTVFGVRDLRHSLMPRWYGPSPYRRPSTQSISELDDTLGTRGVAPRLRFLI